MSLITKGIDIILHIDVYLGDIIKAYGSWTYAILFLIIFCETGLIVTPFLPGDSLLFVTGTFAAKKSLNIFTLLILLSIAAIIGDTVNYWIGNYFGEKVFLKSRLVKREHLDRTKEFYNKYGGKTIILARFVPIVRTFAPFVAGVGKMDYFKFISYNVIGGIVWVAIFLFGGYFFGNIPIVEENLTLVIFLIIFLSFMPPIIEYWKEKKKLKH
ncbi:DedA family protein [Candidatus Woesearchaeota archaeon]|nr:DedA family protein [Candidatus Woesearchaeota archaeon]